jgi:hypothetical protein
MRDEIRKQRRLILSPVTGRWNDNPSNKITNEHAWSLEELVLRKVIERTAEKEYRLMATEKSA